MKSASRKIAGIYPKSPEPELEAILDISDNAFVLYDPVGAIRIASRLLRPLLGLSGSERNDWRDFAGFSRLLSRRLANRDRPIRAPWILWQTGAARELLELSEGGKILERIVRPISLPSQQVVGWVERYRDSTGDREVSARLLQIDKLAAIGQMVAGITHELNNPLTAILGYSNLLLERPLDPKSLGEVQRISREAERATRIVRNLLLMAREATLERSVVNLNEIIDRTLRLCAYDLRHGGIDVETDLDPHLPDTVANPVQLQQVVLNLLLNSQQAIAAARRPGRIVLRTRCEGDGIQFQVEDNGPGIPPDLQSRVFEPFFTTKPPGVGTGLGLSIVAGILRQHNAEIHLTKSGPEGTTFTIALPVAPNHAEGPHAPLAQAANSAGKLHLLVVEGEPELGRSIFDTLAGSGYQVELLSDASEALDRARQTDFDLIVCDENMREADGPELYRVLAATTGLSTERLLLIGSAPSLHDTRIHFPDGKPATMARPFAAAELKEAVAQLFAKRSKSNAVQAHSAVEAI